MTKSGTWMDDWDHDVAELGERVAECLTEDMQLYTRLNDRAWHVVLVCYGRVVRSLGYAPAEWTPHLDDNDMWRMPLAVPVTGPIPGE